MRLLWGHGQFNEIKLCLVSLCGSWRDASASLVGLGSAGIPTCSVRRSHLQNVPPASRLPCIGPESGGILTTLKQQLIACSKELTLFFSFPSCSWAQDHPSQNAGNECELLASSRDVNALLMPPQVADFASNSQHPFSLLKIIGGWGNVRSVISDVELHRVPSNSFQRSRISVCTTLRCR